MEENIRGRNSRGAAIRLSKEALRAFRRTRDSGQVTVSSQAEHHYP